MLQINDILDKVQSYLSPSELEMIEKAYIFSASVHQEQIRLSGEPYLTHPMEVCGILAQMKLIGDARDRPPPRHGGGLHAGADRGRSGRGVSSTGWRISKITLLIRRKDRRKISGR